MTDDLHSPLSHALTRSVQINARVETVFRFFTDNARFAAWWGAGSTIEPRVGGKVHIRYPNAVEVSGEVLEFSAPTRLAFTYGYESGMPFGPGESRVDISLAAHAGGPRLTLAHAVREAADRDQHVQGWRYQLSVFSNAVSDEVAGSIADSVSAWYSAWSASTPDACTAALSAIADPTLAFRDRYSCTDGIDDLVPHILASQRFMPGMTLTADGAPRHCQGTVLANYAVTGPDGTVMMRGTNVFLLNPDGKIAMVTGVA